MIRYRVHHRSTFKYGEPVVTSHNEARLTPRRIDGQLPRDSEIEIDPSPDKVVWRRDYFGNDVLFFDLKQPHDELVVVARSQVDVARGTPTRTEPSPRWEDVARSVHEERSEPLLEALQFVFDSTSVRAEERLASYAQPSFHPGRPILEAVLDLNHRIHTEFEYDQKATTLATPIEEVLENRKGVCQDFAHLMIGCLRSLGVPARYVSGYVGPAPSRDGVQRPQEADPVGAHASHAWLSAFCGSHGWIDVDPTNDALVGDQHVILGWGRDYDDVSPIKGVTLGGGRQEVSVEVVVQPIE